AQADGRRAGPGLPLQGPVASAAWQRYLESFRPLRARRRQRGSILIPAALAILIGVALLGAAQL
ncbi:DUF3613 domain-containing protein, partial [Bordetella pertussis]|uniref:DUF3613 domain-containing protein n=1 Tax=Bordetella pertussis TaxID=520 RepID=UPI0021CB8BBC